jgi:hypothetical protein
VLSSLNEKLLGFSEISADLESLYSDLLERSKIANDSITKARLYDALELKMKETEAAMKSEVDAFKSKLKFLEDENSRLRNGLNSANEQLL